MNVTSLLNTAAHAAGRLSNDLSGVPVDANIAMYQTQEDRMDMSRTTSDQRLPVRNRTPWTGGGYSLGLTMNVKDSQNSRPFNPESTPVDSSTGSTSPKSPKHKSSDSRSSMSSYTTMSSNNSCHSRSHSRISSLSTVSEYQPLSSYGSESTPTERRLSGHENGLSCPTVVEIQPPSPRREDGPFDGSDNDDAMNSDRARSPSDAILMRNRVGGSARYVVVPRATFLLFSLFSSQNRIHYPATTYPIPGRLLDVLSHTKIHHSHLPWGVGRRRDRELLVHELFVCYPAFLPGFYLLCSRTSQQPPR